jgi:hypothetical protein
MPYITGVARRWYEPELNKLLERIVIPTITPGDVNYIITRIIWQYVRAYGLSYGVLNDVVGILECAKAEFQRRVVAPYENKKIRENGDVYD